MAPPLPLQLSAGSHGILLFHGLSSTPLELQYLARGLNRAGYSVRLPVVKGYTHGLDSDRKPDFKAWIADALAEFDAMREKYDTVAVGGLCMGASLALCVAALRPTDVSAVMSMSTTLHFDGWANSWTRRLLPLAPYLPFAGRISVKESEPYGLKDERLRKWIAGQMNQSGASDAGAAVLKVSGLVEAKKLMRQAKLGLGKICAPTLVVHAVQDDVASPRSANDVVTGVTSDVVRRVLLNDSYHMISIDKEKFKVLAELKAFADACTNQHVTDKTDQISARAVVNLSAQRVAAV